MYLAEYLPRLETLTITVNTINVTRVSKNDNGNILIDKEEVVLPVDILSMKIVSMKNSKSTTTFNLKVTTKGDNEKHQHFTIGSLNTSSSFIQKWSVKDLLQKTTQNHSGQNQFKFICKNCKTSIIESGEDLKFFDMPSEFWAEMMDFWHCHKPNIQSKDLVKEKSYFQGDIKPGDNEVVIGNHYLYFEGHHKSNMVKVDGDVCICQCDTVLGEYISKISILGQQMYFKVNKWNLELIYGDGIMESYHSYLYLFNVIMDKINSLAIRKFQIRDKFVWVLNIGVDMSTNSQINTNCLKILYKDMDDELKFDDSNTERIDAPDIVYNDFIEKIELINSTIPEPKVNISAGDENRLMVYKVSYIPSS